MHYSQGTNAGNFLAHYPKQRQIRSKLSSILALETQTIAFHPKHIANAFQKYYKNLYNLNQDPHTPQPTEPLITNFLNSFPSVFEEIINDLNSPFTDAEIKAVTKSMPNNQSPGAAGFTAEYYKTYNDVLAPHLTQLFTKLHPLHSFPNKCCRLLL